MMHKLRVETPNDMQCPWEEEELDVSIIISMHSEKQGI